MKSIKDIMQEMGFNKEAPLESQKAFVRHLIAAANQTAPRTLNQLPKEVEPKPKQMEFEFPEDKQVS